MGGIKRQELLQAERRRQPATLADLKAQGVEVFCWCNRCSHNAVLALDSLLPLLGHLCPVPEIGARLVCSSCGSKDVATRPAWKGLGQVTSHEVTGHEVTGHEEPPAVAPGKVPAGET